MKHTKHTLQQVSGLHGHFVGIAFRNHMARDAGGAQGNVQEEDPIVRLGCGTEELDYGHLAAYCFRRFGYPEHGWDGGKELVGYMLTTPHSDLVLRVVPHVRGSAKLSMRFLVEHDVLRAVDLFERKATLAWEARSLDWAEAQGLPDWMPEWVDVFNAEMAPVVRLPQARNWRDAVRLFVPIGAVGSRAYELTERVAQFRQKLKDDFSKVEPCPEPLVRSHDISTWGDDDPLKALALAAISALQDLKTPVGVRDADINAYGLVEGYSRASRKPALSAGYPSGALGNHAPELFAQLHSAITALGGGDAVKGLERALAKLQDKGAK